MGDLVSSIDSQESLDDIDNTQEFRQFHDPFGDLSLLKDNIKFNYSTEVSSHDTALI